MRLLNAMDVENLLKTRRPELEKFDVADLFLFGSAARGQSPINDLDFLVKFRSQPRFLNFMGLKFFLEELFELPVDLHTQNSCPPHFKKAIHRDLTHVA